MTSGANDAIASRASASRRVSGCSHGNAERERALLDRARGEARGRGRSGRSGWVKTATSRWREVAIASSEGTAKSGVPAKTTARPAIHGGAAGQIAGARDVSGARPSARSFRSFSSFLRTRWRFISER